MLDGCRSRAAFAFVALTLACSCTGEISGAVEEVSSNVKPLTTNLSDGFESGNLTAGSWAATGDVSVLPAAAHTGSYGVRLGRDGVITLTVDTTGFWNIQITFDWRGVAIDLFEYGVFEWAPPGGSFTQVATTTFNAWGTRTVVLPADADDRAGVSVRFRLSASASREASSEFIDVDNLIVRGTAILVAEEQAPASPAPWAGR